MLHDCRPTFVPLTELKPDAGACTISVRPGDDLQNAVDSLPATGGELCLAAGVYVVAAPVQIKARSRIVVTGAGPASIIRASGHEAALLVDTSDEIEIRNIRVEGGTPSPGGDPALNGAITVTGSSRVRIADCTVACPGAQAVRNQTCITARSGSGRNVQDLRLERNALEIGPWQTGILVVDADSARVSGNRLSLPPGIGVSALTGADELVVRLTRNLVTAAIAAAASAATKQVPIPGASPINVVVGSDAEKLIDALAPKLAPGQVVRRGVAGALAAAVRRAVSPEGFATLPNSAQVVITGVRQGLLSAGQGIVVGGSRAGTIQIHDNVVEDTVEGIHVGLSTPSIGGREAADEVVIARNHIHLLVPRLYDRERHAVFAGNVRSLHILDTVATLRRGGKSKLAPTAVEAIRIRGELGPFVCIRQASLGGFSIGVRVLPLGTVPVQRMWLVSETAAIGASAALSAPTTVDRQRNIP